MSTPPKSNFFFPPEQPAPTVAEMAAVITEHQKQKPSEKN